MIPRKFHWKDAWFILRSLDWCGGDSIGFMGTFTTIVVIQSQKAGHHTRKAEERKTQKGKTHSVSPMENFLMSSEGSENIFI